MKKYSQRLNAGISRIRKGQPNAFSGLTKMITGWNRNHGAPPDGPEPMTSLLLAFSQNEEDAHTALYTFYPSRRTVPAQYRLACFQLIHSYAEKGEAAAMNILSELCYKNSGMTPEEEATIDERGTKQLTTEAGLAWTEKGLASNPSEGDRVNLRRNLALFHMRFREYEKAFPILKEFAEKGDWVKMHYVTLLHEGLGCERNLPEAIKVYEKMIEDGFMVERHRPELQKAKDQLNYHRKTLQIPYGEETFEARVYGTESSSKYAVIFGSSGFNLRGFNDELGLLKPLFDEGWNVLAFDYPKNKSFAETKLAIAKWLHSDITAAAPVIDFTGFGKCVYDSLVAYDPKAEFCFIGNSLGAGAMAWDLAEIRKEHPLRVLWISPTEVFLPDLKTIKSLGEISLIASKGEDDFVRGEDLKQWISQRSINSKLDGHSEIPDGHLIFGDNLPWEKIFNFILQK